MRSQPHWRNAIWGGLAVALVPMPALAAPDTGVNWRRASVAAQCAAYWTAFGRTGLASSYRKAAVVELGTADVDHMMDQLAPLMEQFAHDVARGEPHALALAARHSALCTPLR